MHLFDLIGTMDWIDVERSLLQQYPEARDSSAGFRQTLSRLRCLEAVATAMRLCLRTTFRAGLDDEPFLEVVGKNGTLNRDLEDVGAPGEAEDSPHALREAEFALEFEPWSEWLGMEIDDDTLEKFPPSEIVAHCLLGRLD
jgi:hypothetical protein